MGCDSACINARQLQVRSNHPPPGCCSNAVSQGTYPPSFITIVALLFAVSLPVVQISRHLLGSSVMVFFTVFGPPLLIAGIFWDYLQRDIGRLRLEPGYTLIAAVLCDIIAHALTQVFELGLSMSNGSQVTLAIVILATFGGIEIFR